MHVDFMSWNLSFIMVLILCYIKILRTILQQVSKIWIMLTNDPFNDAFVCNCRDFFKWDTNWKGMQTNYYKELFMFRSTKENTYLMCQSGFSLFQVLLWINQSFLLQDDIDAEGSLNVAFMSLRGSGPLFLKMEPQGLVIYIHCILIHWHAFWT